jgi:hypothetical protein
MTDLFKFWAAVPGDAHQHPADATVLGGRSHNFRLDCLPSPFFGRLRCAPVVSRLLSPGFQDVEVPHANLERTKALYKRQRTGDEWLPSEAEHKTAWDWWARFVRPIGLNLADVRNRVAFLNISAYKSPEPRDYRMIEDLPSSRVCLSWAQSVLFPQAERGERVVVCLRSAAYWGLKPGEEYGSSLFAPKTGRGGRMHHLPLRDKVITAIEGALRTNGMTII